MSKKFKSQASSSRAAAGAFGSFGGFSGTFGNDGREPSSLTYITEPPDLSRISEQQVVIAFKNFQKKDDTTRTKSLEELKDYVVSVEEKNDTSRRVRQLAHMIQGLVSCLVGKRIVPQLPKVVGAWLAGIYDNDRPVQRVALDSFTKVFTTEEKRSNVWKIYQSSTLDFIDDVILHQTPLTLSDERTVKRDDAEAKYARVVGAALMLFNRIIGMALESLSRCFQAQILIFVWTGNSPNDDLQKNAPEIEKILSSKTLWGFCNHEDPFVRRSTYTLLRVVVSREPGWVDWKLISSAIIGKSLSLPQLGSSSELSEALLVLTSSRPHVWTDDYIGKTSASKRLRQYIQKGSQGGSGSFWSNLDKLLRIIPREILVGADKTSSDDTVNISSAVALTEAIQEGLTAREEPRQNLVTGWKAYIRVGSWLGILIPQDQRSEFIQQRLAPLAMRYVRPDPESSQWALPSQQAQDICADFLAVLISHEHGKELEPLWTKLANDLVEAVKLSSPEQSRDFNASQDAICSEARRLFSLEPIVLSRITGAESESTTQSVFEKVNLGLVESCLQVLRSRNGKPYGAAGVVEECVCTMPSIAKHSQELLRFVQSEAPDMLFTPSGNQVISIILACREWEGYSSSFESVVERALQLEPEQSNAHILQNLLSNIDFNEVGDKEKLQTLVMRALNKACKGSEPHWQIIRVVLKNPSSRNGLTDRIFLTIVDSLGEEEGVFDVLNGLNSLGKTVPTAIKDFQHGPYGSKLTEKLLYLAESPSEDIAALTESLIKSFRETVVGDTSSRSKIEILKNGFRHAGDLLQQIEDGKTDFTVKDILPSASDWENALAPFLRIPPRPSTAITSPLLGAVHLVQPDISDSLKNLWLSVPRDSNRCTAAFRVTAFITKLMSSFDLVTKLDSDDLESLFVSFPLALQLIDDDLSIENCNGISGVELADQRDEYLELVIQGRAVINKWMHSKASLKSSQDTSISSYFVALWEEKLDQLNETFAVDYRIGQTFVKLMTSLDINKSSDDVAKICRDGRTANAIRSASWFSVLRSSILTNSVGSRICNELVADSTGLKPDGSTSQGLRKLVLLNILLSGEEDVVSTIPTQRLVFLTKNLLECLQSDALSLGLKAEILQTLAFVLLGLSEIYGSHWEEIIKALISIFKEVGGGEEGLPLLVSGFRLFVCLKNLLEGECNDDLQDTWSDQKTDLYEALISTIGRFDSSTVYHQPRDVAVDLLRRIISTIPVENLKDVRVSAVFPLLTSHSRAVQRTAYALLHRYIPQSQEQVSFDVALSKTAVSLPDELLSLLLETPSVDTILRSYEDDKTWTSVRSYLLSWKVVFDHFTNASLPVQEYYATNIKENNVLIPLLEFTFDFLQKSQGKLVDASKFDLQSFEPDQSESAEKEIQWLLVNLYYLCLKHLANMTKNWWIDTHKRIKGPVEAWTEKYISPAVVESAIQGVNEWLATQDPDEERALAKSLPASLSTRSLLPFPFQSLFRLHIPLHPALVVGRSRVLVDEKKWKSWLLTIQGVIMFANGSLVDGLLAFRRNVQGALRGQSECAICYSVISTDMQTPNKRCATCKNTFHSVCLFRWFKSSNQSTCPLCRNNFVYV
ncbi:hypothetical protein N7470_009584 [Penicillium chermesinum]|nr:hypothetical protein N7470_009584 [Penicillium chermesinum]